MAKVKVAESSKEVLDCLVAMCEGYKLHKDDMGTLWLLTADGYLHDDVPLTQKKYSTNWYQGGPIIEREKIGMLFDAGSACRGPAWFATPDDQQVSHGYEGESFDPAFMVNEADGCYGPTPLIAAMRCYVTSKLGPEVEVPDGLINQRD